jgi:ATP-binding cassette, subfamily B (MDR/TAP), member 1
VGPSGGGKSTTVGLIELFYDPTEGVLEYIGNDVKTLNVSWYRDQIGYVGQEPVLFNDTIARNIAYGAPSATRKEIEEAAIQADAHDFIMQFAERYETPVGERGARLSGGQKQRIAIARALVKKPKVLILDEATSALDNESESIVQAAIDKLMHSRDQTVIIIAHRLSTIRNADCIAVVADGKVVEHGTHDELISRSHGRYRRLFESSKRSATVASSALYASTAKTTRVKTKDDEETNWEAKIEEEAKGAFDASRARNLMTPFAVFLLIGSIGAVMAGAVFPTYGVLFSETINILFRPVVGCPYMDKIIPEGYSSCKANWNGVGDEMQDRSFKIAGFWICLMVGCVLGNIFTYWGFGQAAERLNKRLRDNAFVSLLRQEPSCFDMRSVGKITSELQDDAARVHAFSGDPIRSLIIALSSVVVGLTLSFIVSLRAVVLFCRSNSDPTLLYWTAYVAVCTCCMWMCPPDGNSHFI